jgi:hypothetical protein
VGIGQGAAKRLRLYFCRIKIIQKAEARLSAFFYFDFI